MINRREFLSAGYYFFLGMGLMALLEKYLPSKKVVLDFELRDEQYILDYYSPFYNTAYSMKSLDDLKNDLVAKNIILNDNGLIDLEKLERSIQSEEMIEYKTKLYGESELMLYALAYKLYTNKKTLILENIDLPNGDLTSFKTSGRYTDCLEACIENKECKGFTFATEEHTVEQKRGYCWLKKDGFTFNSGKNYISGIVKH